LNRDRQHSDFAYDLAAHRAGRTADDIDSTNPINGSGLRWRLNAVARPQNEVRTLYFVPTTTLRLSLRSSAALPAAKRIPEYGPACRGSKQLGHTIHTPTLGDMLQRQDLNKDSELT
jgi:hypothetical protein